MLTQEKLKELLHYAPLTGEFTWRVSAAKNVKKGDIAGCIRKYSGQKSYRQITINNTKYQSHRLAFLYMTGHFPVDQADHINGQGLENWWSNLREVTPQENQRNVRLRADNKSGFLGVHPTKNRWRAMIRINGRNKHLGCFLDKQDAIAARQAANIEHGYHANHGQSRPI